MVMLTVFAGMVRYWSKSPYCWSLALGRAGPNFATIVPDCAAAAATMLVTSPASTQSSIIRSKLGSASSCMVVFGPATQPMPAWQASHSVPSQSVSFGVCTHTPLALQVSVVQSMVSSQSLALPQPAGVGSPPMPSPPTGVLPAVPVPPVALLPPVALPPTSFEPPTPVSSPPAGAPASTITPDLPPLALPPFESLLPPLLLEPPPPSSS